MRYCPPIRGAWAPENGTVLRIDPSADGALLFEASCRRHGVPTCSTYDDPEAGVHVPLEVARLVNEAVALAAWPDRAAPVWAEVQRRLDEAARAMAPMLAAAE